MVGICHPQEVWDLFFSYAVVIFYFQYDIKTKYIVKITKEGCTKIVKFMIPGADVLVVWLYRSYSEMHYFFKHFLLYSGIWFRQPLCIVMMTIEGSTKILNFMTPRTWPYNSYCEMQSYTGMSPSDKKKSV